MIPTIKKQAETKFGNANGYRLRNSDPPKRFGCFSAGRASAPPKAGPKILPIVQTIGIILKARGCSSRCGTISATIVRMMPTFPFMKPIKARDTRTIDRLDDIPNMIDSSIVKICPLIMTGLRPIRSDNVPQGTAITA